MSNGLRVFGFPYTEAQSALLQLTPRGDMNLKLNPYTPCAETNP